MSTPSGRALLDLIDRCDNYPYTYPSNSKSYYLFALLTSWDAKCTTHKTIGYILPSVVESMPWTSRFSIDHEARTITIPYSSQVSESEILAEQLALARERQSFRVLAGWRNELYPILSLPSRLVEIERAGSALFGVETRGVHCMAYYSTSAAIPSTTAKLQELKLIIPRRASTKQTYPSLLDNTIAGGISTHETPHFSLLREAYEEAGLREYVTKRAKPVGTISYIHIRDAKAGGEEGLFQPEIEFCYEIELHPEWEEEKVRAVDGEVGEFLTMGIGEVWEHLVKDEFKPNCGLVIVDFLVRWGFIRAGRDWWMNSDGGDDREPEGEGWMVSGEEYAEIVSRLHRKFVWEDVEERKRTASTAKA